MLPSIVQSSTIRGTTMEYVVRTIFTTQRRNENEVVKEHTSFKYQSAFNRTDAERMAEMLNNCVHHHQSGNHRTRRNFDVCAVVWNGKERVYLDLATLEQIAELYTSPDRDAQSAE